MRYYKFSATERNLKFAGNLERPGYSEQQTSIQIRMVAGLVEGCRRLQPSELFSAAL